MVIKEVYAMERLKIQWEDKQCAWVEEIRADRAGNKHEQGKQNKDSK